MTAREDIAAALNSVHGLSAHPYYVQGTNPGHTFVRLERIAYPNKFGGIVTFNIVIVLPQDLATAERFVEEYVPQVKDAVTSDLLVITEVVPQRLDITGVGVLPCVFINGHSEE